MTIMKKGQGKLGIVRISKDGDIETFPIWIAKAGKETIRKATREDLEHAIKAANMTEYTIYKAYANLNLDSMTVSTIKEIGE
jgi:hypothetical protein